MVSDKFYDGRVLKTSVKIMMLVLLLPGVSGAATLTVNASGGADYTRIQDAINFSTAGDTILVYSGTYYENVNVDKQLTMRGIGMPVVDARESGDAITLSAGGSMLDGFIAKNGNKSRQKAGIKVISDSNIIKNNSVLNNYNGIFLYPSSNTTLSGNYVNSNVHIGIYLYSSSNNSLTGNYESNGHHGIYLSFSSNNTLSGNNEWNNSYTGIGLVSSSSNTLSGNNVSNNEGDGIYLSNYSSSNTLSGNKVSNNYADIHISSSSNTIYNNYFNNSNNFQFYGTIYNTWNITKTLGTNIIGGSYLGGNFWANPNGTGFSQTCTHVEDGICDSPYTLDSNNTDYLPLAYNITQTLVDSYLPPGATPAERKAGLIRAMDDYFDNGALTKPELLSVLDAYFA